MYGAAIGRFRAKPSMRYGISVGWQGLAACKLMQRFGHARYSLWSHLLPHCHSAAMQEIRRLLMTKYGKQYDMSFVRRNLPGKLHQQPRQQVHTGHMTAVPCTCLSAHLSGHRCLQQWLLVSVNLGLVDVTPILPPSQQP